MEEVTTKIVDIARELELELEPNNMSQLFDDQTFIDKGTKK